MYRPFLFFILFFVPGIVLGSITKISWIIIFIPITSFIAGIFNKNKKIRALLFAVCIFFLEPFITTLKLHRIMEQSLIM